MPRIPDDLIDRLKREASLVEVVRASGVQLTRRGHEWIGLCPLHADQKTPSLSVNPEKGAWRCFGCGRGGSVIDWRMEKDGVSFRPAVESLLRDYLPDAEIEEPTPEQLPAEEVERLIAAPDAELLRWVHWVYRDQAEDPKLAGYLESRGLTHPELAEHFQLGYSARTLGLMLPAKAWKAGKAIRDRLQELGILRETGHEHLSGRLVVPLWTAEMDVGQLYGRSITRNLRAGTRHHLYLKGERGHCLFHPEAVAEHRELIVTEAPIDAMTYWTHGFRNVTSAYGAHGFPKALYEAMKRFGTRRVLMAYDRDPEGEAGAQRVAERLLAAGIECYRVLYPKGMDANDVARTTSPAPKALDLGLRQASWMGTGRPPSERVPAMPARTSPPPAPEPPSKPAAKKEQQLPEKAAEEREPLSSSAAPATSEGPKPEAAAPAPGPSPSPPAAEDVATVLPALPPVELPLEISEHEVVMRIGDRRYRVRGLAKNHSLDVLKVNLLVSRREAFHVDTLDLYASRQRGGFLKQAASELGLDPALVKDDLRKVLLRLEAFQAAELQKELEPKEVVVTLTDAETKEARALLEDPEIADRLLEDLEACGVVGEETNKLVGYLATISRLLPKPLAVMVQSSSAAGKSALMESVLAMVPEEHKVAYSAMTGQSLFYLGEQDLARKVLAIAEEEGAEQASYALKLLQSEGRLSIASTGKDPHTGRLTTHEYHVEGPAAILTTTTSIDLDEELLNRCLVLTVDESREQTRAIHRYQREAETLEGLLRRQKREGIRKKHRNAQRLLRPLGVVNLYAQDLTFPESCTRTRRDHEKYLTLIRSIALLRQYQREVQAGTGDDGEAIDYIEVALEDIALANRLAHEVLGRTLDELPPQTRKLLLEIEGLVAAVCEEEGGSWRDFRFYRRWLREKTSWGDTQLKVHLARLVEMEYLAVHRIGHAQRHAYELLYDGSGRDGEPFLPGLLDVATLQSDANRSGLSENRSGQNGNRSGSGRPLVGGWSGGGRSELEPTGMGVSGRNRPPALENAHLDPQKALSSQRSRSRRSERPAEVPS